MRPITSVKSKQYVSSAPTSKPLKRHLLNVSRENWLDYYRVTAGENSLSSLKKLHETGDKTATKVFETTSVSFPIVHNKTEAADIPLF
jgi:hypothetical protein